MLTYVSSNTHSPTDNSVLDGDAASSGGKYLVVRLFIEQGADENASRYIFSSSPSSNSNIYLSLTPPHRFPCRFSDRHRDASIVCASESTPSASQPPTATPTSPALSYTAHMPIDLINIGLPEMVARENGRERKRGVGRDEFGTSVGVGKEKKACSSNEGRAAILKGVNVLAKAVSVILGPKCTPLLLFIVYIPRLTVCFRSQCHYRAVPRLERVSSNNAVSLRV